MKLPACHHGYEYLYQCPKCCTEPDVPDPLLSPRAHVVRPRNRAERRKVDAFLRRNPGMRP
jgi:hypothetical protein